MSARRILVTGGQGYLGTALTEELVNHGHQVVVVDNGLTSSVRLPLPGVRYLEGDVREPGTWASALAEVDAVVHLAAVVGDPACAVDPDLSWEVNYLGTARVADACRAHRVRDLVLASTCSNYGVSAAAAADVDSPVYPQSVYAESKVHAEHYLLAAAADGGLRPVILRFATLFGLAPRMRFDLAVNVMTARAVHEGVVPVHGGTQWRPFLHVRDAAAAVRLALSGPAAASGGARIYNCGSGRLNHRIADLGRMIAEEVPGATVSIGGGDGDSRDYQVSFDRIRAELGFEPRTSVPAGVREIRDALLAGTPADFTEEFHSDVRMVERAVRERRPNARTRNGGAWPTLIFRAG
ncbi:NAD(P)-dependent oxidoreductase [Crossiella sp. CA-258035]|uniref:NAD-dependent epimerase/dehydratase family protein n=1 Tax=Crossiella sp. CA-258035 TaxID=2981138 RepID=UPI0024BCAEFB|nr:NAD(P)-dependent oxidoreductase [Crossiella sp. CA-258035]WHT15785.1 NAD(P)-dependent oxidoreductase [Crossiella sp. CA-258035]